VVAVTSRSARAFSWGVFGLAVLLAVAGNVLLFLSDRAVIEDSVFGLIFMSMGAVGALIASRRPENAIGWILVGTTLMIALSFAADEYAIYSSRERSLPGATWAAWLSGWGWTLAIAPMVTLLFLLFPDGHPPSSRWRPIAWASGALIVLLSLLAMVDPMLDMPEDAANPIGIEAAGAVIGEVVGVGFLVLAVLALLCAASLVVRFRRARGEEREQIEWLAYGGVLLAVYLLLTTLGEWTRVPLLVDSFLMTALSAIAFTSIPLAVGVALLRYRLYEIDVVINKTVVVAVLATFVTAVYLAIVVGIGTAIGTRGEPNLVLSIAATAVIALAFQPLRERARRLADRVVYGKRATPYEVLSDFSERMASAYSTEDVLPRMSRILGEGTGATRTEVWLRVGERLQLAASWPEGGEPETTTIPILEGELPGFPDATRSVPVRHQSELLGALTLTKPPSEPVTPAEEKLLTDLASQAGLMLRNVRLTAELQARLVELRASRQRLVAAQDEERRKIERNIHDGAQQQLVALAVKLRLAENVAKREEAAKTGEMLGDLQVDTTDALETLRDLARGIYPPLLADKGLAAALEAQAQKGTIPTAVHAHGIDRYPMEIEAAVYFCSLEALQNVGKYAKASTATIRVAEEDGHLTFEVADDGLGFDPDATGRGTGLQGMTDRLDAIDGTLEVRSAPGRGTRVTGRVRLP
jgi:signal transduction histidine kinase